MNSNKLAMSRALGAAFLNHQVEQLEKTVTSGPATNSNNWRERKRSPHEHIDRGITPTGRGKRPLVPGAGKRGGETERPKTRDGERWDKDADIVVVDASVLIHCIGQFKRWCRDDRQEIVIVPLEALNTLDLLKKGTSPLAQRARAASRILEAQVGVNSRIRVQRDDAFVLWDDITFTGDDQDKDKVSAANTGLGSPEWVRRTICCARWEVNSSTAAVISGENNNTLADDKKISDKTLPGPKVILAVVSSPAQLTLTPTVQTDSSPVPLPAPQKHEPRSAGALVAYWARKAGIQVMEVKPGVDEDEGSRKRNPTTPAHGRGHHHGGAGREGRAPGGGRGGRNSHERGAGGGGGMVERPPTVMAMMEMVGQPGKGVRVLARGEKLEPDAP
ncbi:hypothetical protein NEOLEDRAFT_318632 [Neolentinus lepideus HHB14362 ss-1]|uniref:PIN domain-containing protein n=1 Tax=Neolentinus lepideus HHB14362 ss-1 TaxID=1314782 RepID=A0A165VUT0_9AGAM|nr:hypothetical protein NEOLEDRAFT_318632 [Neolentinus lepideus HHB14362 ss-1]